MDQMDDQDDIAFDDEVNNVDAEPLTVFQMTFT